jgi:C1A family cysteine protease
MIEKLFLVVCLLSNISCVSCKTFHERFYDWAEQHKISFINTAHEYKTFSTWVENDKYIDTINSQNMTYTLGHNQFSGLDTNEFAQYLGFAEYNLDSSYLRGSSTFLLKTEPAESVDWVKAGAVTPVKNQGQCGSCWSFSTTGALEGAYFNKYGELKSFSEQQLVSCDNFKNGGTDMGCNGGLMDHAFNWIEKNGGLCYEDDYPYTSGTTKSAGTCENTCSVDEKSKITSFVDVKKNSDEEMMKAITLQPVSIAIQADQKDFQLYKSGVFTGGCGTSLDHGVLVVGYGSMDGNDFYMVKNSWGTTWGDNGYIYLGRGSEYNNGSGQCGMLMQGSYPIL